MLITKITFHQLKMARLLLDLSQEEVSKLLNISRAAYSSIEKGKSDPKLSNYITIVDFYIKRGIIFNNDGTISLNDS